jgi:hypothetical protein
MISYTIYKYDIIYYIIYDIIYYLMYATCTCVVVSEAMAVDIEGITSSLGSSIEPRSKTNFCISF